MSFCLFVWHLFCKERSPVCACEDICTCMRTHSVCVCHMHTLWVYSCLLHVNMHVVKNTVHLCSKTIISWECERIRCQPLTNSSVTSLCLSPAWRKPASLCPPSLSFSGHCIYDDSKRTKALFCYWSGSFWFGLTARTIIGTGGALQCTFHTALAKSCKRDWFREVWHQSWLHDMKSY